MPRCREADLVATIAGDRRRILKIGFRRDGSILVMFPGLSNQMGIVAHAVFDAPRIGIQRCKLAESGRTTSHLVKYTHHSDGHAHFSQDGKVRTEVRKQAEDLVQQEGHLFSVHVAGVHSYKTIDAKGNRTTVALTDADDLRAFTLICTRHKFEEEQASDPQGFIQRDGTHLRGYFLRAPRDFRLSDHALFLRVDHVQAFRDPDQTALFFIGGFDSRRVTASTESPTSVLVAMYPCTNTEHLVGHVPSIDSGT